MASIVLVPLGVWLYADVASADRGPVVHRNESTFRGLRHPAGARVVGEHSYALYRWDIEGSLTPVVGYRTEFFLRLPHAETATMLLAHYVRALASWRATVAADGATFVRDGVTITVDTAETAPGQRRVREYGLYVSQ